MRCARKHNSDTTCIRVVAHYVICITSMLNSSSILKFINIISPF
jgi:hypothetical protein